jgi:hypothetical protein
MLLLQLSRVTDRVPEWVIALIGRLERREVKRLEKFYTMAIDYLYWYGAFGALREERSGGASVAVSLGTHTTSRRARGT